MTGREEGENEATDSDSEMEGESSDESQIECDVSNMDISEELRQYFAQTEQHRQELSKCLTTYRCISENLNMVKKLIFFL